MSENIVREEGTSSANKPVKTQIINDVLVIDDPKAVLKPEPKSKVKSKVKAKPESLEPQPKTMGNTDQNGCRKNVKDVVMFGDDLFKLLSKASSESEGWMKSTKAMDTGKGCVVQVTTQQRNLDGSYAVAEALTFVPGVKILDQIYKGQLTGRKLVGVR